MPYEVAATAWTQLIGCPTYEGAATLDAIRDFRDIYRGQGPEDVPMRPASVRAAKVPAKRVLSALATLDVWQAGRG